MLPRLRLRPANATRCHGSGCARRKQRAAAAPAAPGQRNALPRLRLRPAKATRPANANAAAAPAAPGESNVPGESAAHRLTQRGQRGVVVGLLHDFGDKFGMDNGA